jgi:hypothetical protein
MVTARKEYKCGECDDVIKKGDVYEYVKGLWEGYWETHRTCKTCVAIRDDLFHCGFAYGTLWEELREHFEDYNDDWLK